MKLVLRISILLLGILLAAYHIYFFVVPSVTVVNNSNSAIENARVDLPNSGLDFGQLAKGDTNTIHYALKQTDGEYHYQIRLTNGLILKGRCGDVTNNEVHKRLTVLVQQDRATCKNKS